METKKSRLTSWGKTYLIGIALLLLAVLASRLSPGGTIHSALLLASAVTLIIATVTMSQALIKKKR